MVIPNAEKLLEKVFFGASVIGSIGFLAICLLGAGCSKQPEEKTVVALEAPAEKPALWQNAFFEKKKNKPLPDTSFLDVPAPFEKEKHPDEELAAPPSD